MSQSPVGRVFGAIVPRALDAIDPDELIERVDLDAALSRMDLDALLARIDLQALIESIELDPVLARVDVDQIISRVDLGAVLESVDMDALLARIDVQALIEGIDLDPVLAQVDIDGLVSRVDIGGLIAEVDIDALVRRVDVDALIGQVDLDALMARIDIDALMARVDVDALMTRVDVDALIGRVDINRLLDQVDLPALVARAGIDQIVRDATTGIATRTIDLARRQVLGIDAVAGGLVDRALRRTPAAATVGRRPRYGGPLGRLLAFLADSAVVATSFGLVVSLGAVLVGLFTGTTPSADRNGGPWWILAYAAWWFTYLWIGVSVAGRTVGKALVGLQVVSVDGGRLRPRQAAVRAVFLPVSFVLGLGFLPAVLGRQRRALHDLVAGSAVVVDWGGRDAELPSALSDWIDQRHPGVELEPRHPGTDPAASAPATPIAPRTQTAPESHSAPRTATPSETAVVPEPQVVAERPALPRTPPSPIQP